MWMVCAGSSCGEKFTSQFFGRAAESYCIVIVDRPPPHTSKKKTTTTKNKQNQNEKERTAVAMDCGAASILTGALVTEGIGTTVHLDLFQNVVFDTYFYNYRTVVDTSEFDIHDCFVKSWDEDQDDDDDRGFHWIHGKSELKGTNDGCEQVVMMWIKVLRQNAQLPVHGTM